MAELIAIGYPDETTASLAAEEVRRLSSELIIERMFRDIQGARFHPLQAGPQARYAGAMALGQPTQAVF